MGPSVRQSAPSQSPPPSYSADDELGGVVPAVSAIGRGSVGKPAVDLDAGHAARHRQPLRRQPRPVGGVGVARGDRARRGQLVEAGHAQVFGAGHPWRPWPPWLPYAVRAAAFGGGAGPVNGPFRAGCRGGGGSEGEGRESERGERARFPEMRGGAVE
ncbi:hypothetical protein GCM10009801_20490 [Streptomyces albiaxialis]|uniref:Uncharacterized protein n=1 Tax=Streptomyces albiaxialis TaxID=329523 RepID=A0ABN2VR65_9ACTN